MPYRLGVDTGGTFTDLALIDDVSGEARLHKLASTPWDPSEAIITGIRELLTGNGVAAEDIVYLGHGTTVSINAVLQQKLARTSLITTAGFRDVLELARQRRPDLWDMDVDKPAPVVPRNRRLEVRERLLYDGSVIVPLDEEQIRKMALAFKETGITAVAICFLHSYLNPLHERRAKEILQEICPGCAVSISSEVLPEFREFERFSTTTINAALMPVMSNYLRKLEASVVDLGIPVGPHIMQSNGGIMGSAAASERPINTLFSGPSAGVIGAAYVSSLTEIADIITFDMGGTSTDVCLVEKGNPLVTNQRALAGFPVKSPTIDVHSIGAGGGSIGWVDTGGFLRVGPQSAGARPGPACYGLGGEEPTVTDANVVLGRLNPERLLSGRMRIDKALAERAILEKVASLMGMDLISAARGIIAIVNSNIIGAIRVISVERGYDPRNFTLVAFGGAGPLHTGQLARELGLPRVLVPESPGVLCALGLLVADLRADFVRTLITPCSRPDVEAINRCYHEMESQAALWLEREQAKPEDSFQERSAEVRYVGQDFGVPVPVSLGDLGRASLAQMEETFHAVHEQVHGYCAPGAPVEIAGLSLVARSKVPKPAFRLKERGGRYPSGALIGQRRTHFDEAGGFVECPLYERSRLSPGNVIEGPAILEQMDSTTILLPGQRGEVDGFRNVMIYED